MTSPRRLPGRYIRAFTGCVMIVGSVLIYFLHHDSPTTWQDVAVHAALIIGGLLMVDPSIGQEIKDIVRAWRGTKE